MARIHAKMYPGLNEDIIKRLRTINVNNVFDFVKHDDERLTKLVGLSHENVKAFKKWIVESFSAKARSARELLIIEENNIVSTGISSLDELLNGGLHAGQLYEICGLSSAGKTQICHSLAINVITKTDGIVHYIDTKRDFSAGRIQMILDARKHGDEEAARVMDQIKVTRVTNIHELLSVLYNLTNTLKKIANEKSTKLVVIDSLYTTILASSENHKSFYSLSHLAGVCKFIAKEFSCSVITVNMLKEWRDGDGFMPVANVKPVVVKPTLGKFWIQAPNTRIVVRKLDNEERKISVWKSYDLRVGANCVVNLTNLGITRR